MKKGYYYLFYKLYKLAQRSPSKSSSFRTAGTSLALLEIWALISINNYYSDFSFPNGMGNSYLYRSVAFLLSVIILNYWMFFRNNTWKEYVEEFDQWPARKNRVGTWVAVAIVVFILGNLFLSFYIMSVITGIK